MIRSLAMLKLIFYMVMLVMTACLVGVPVTHLLAAPEDSLNGGAGDADIADYSASNDGVTIDLSITTRQTHR